MNVLFLGNDASRTGAPIGLLHLLRWLRAHTDVTFSLVLRRGDGALRADYEALGRVIAYDALYSDRGPVRRLARRLGQGRLGHWDCRSPLEVAVAGETFDLIYANTLIVGGMLADLALLRAPVLCHAHELQTTIDAHGPRNLRLIKRHANRFVADSAATRANLMRNGVAGARIAVVSECIDVAALPSAADAGAVRRELAIPADAFVVGGCGYPYHRKGKDLFVQVVRELIDPQTVPAVYGLWVGGDAAGPDAERFYADIRAAGLGDRIRVVPQVDNPFRFYPAMDVLALTSREEPFGMVMLEAAAYACPTVAFAAAGGPAEFIESDAGGVVPGCEVGAMAAWLAALAADPARRCELGRRARAKLRERHDVGIIAPQLYAHMQADV